MRDLLEKALRIQEREYGAEHRLVATTLTNLGSAYWDLGDAQKTRDLLEKALRIKEREYGHQHRQVAITLDNLGSAYGALGYTQTKRCLGACSMSSGVLLASLGTDQSDDTRLARPKLDKCRIDGSIATFG